MDFEIVLELLNDAMSMKFGRPLNDAELALFKGAWQGQTYEAIAAESGYAASYLTRIVGPKFWKNLSQALGVKVSKTSFRSTIEQRYIQSKINIQPRLPVSLASSTLNSPPLTPTKFDWGEAPDVSSFYGREHELKTIQKWALTEAEQGSQSCRLIAVLGMGGIGKSSLASRFLEILAESSNCPFTHIIWRSLRNAPPFQDFIADLVLCFSDQQDTGGTPQRLLYWLRQSRCLLVLDNLETLLQGGDRAGIFRSDYEEYGQLLKWVAETRHQSCLILTSREKPAIVGELEGAALSVRSLQLSGSPEAALALLEAKGLKGTSIERNMLGDRYNYSPLALKIVATSIQTLFDGEIGLFLSEDTLVFNGLQRLLEQQFERLTELEKTVMYWLSLNRDWTSTSELLDDIRPMVSRYSLLETLESLSWRSLIEAQSGRYTLQPTIMEFTTHLFVTQISTEILTQQLSLFHLHPFIQTTVSDPIRQTQTKLILDEISQRIGAHFQHSSALEQHLQRILEQLRSTALLSHYGGGNLIHLIRYLDFSLAGYDFSQLVIAHADFKGMAMHHINFQAATFTKSLFTQTFGGIQAVALNPDANLLAIGDNNGSIYLWQTRDPNNRGLGPIQPLMSLEGHLGWILYLAWHPQGNTLASCSGDCTIKLWERATGKCLLTLQGHSQAVTRIAWSPDGSHLASCSNDGTIKIWNPKTGNCLKTLFGHDTLVWSISWHPDGNILVSGSDDQTIRFWDHRTGECTKVITVEGQCIGFLDWSPDGKTLASSVNPGLKIFLWDSETGQLLRCLEGHTKLLMALAWSPDGKILASSSCDRTIKLWDATQGNCLQTLQGHRDDIWSLSWNQSGTQLVSGSFDQTVRLWNIDTGDCHQTIMGYLNLIRSVVWSPDGNFLASSSTDKTIRVWNALTGECINTLEGHQGWVLSVAWNRVESGIRTSEKSAQQTVSGILASTSSDFTTKLWNLQTGECFETLREHQSWVWAAAWSPKKIELPSGIHQLLATASSSPDLTIRLSNPDTGKCFKVLSGHQSWVWWVVWHPDGSRLATVSDDNTIKLWDVLTGDCLKTVSDPRLLGSTVTWSPDGNDLATTTTEGTIRIWNLESETFETELRGHQALVWALDWSPDGTMLVSGSDDGIIKYWNLDSFDCTHTLKGHQNRIWSMALSPDGERVASSSLDGTIRLWDALTGECLRVLRSDRPYEGMNITGVKGITNFQKATLKALGAIDYGDLIKSAD